MDGGLIEKELSKNLLEREGDQIFYGDIFSAQDRQPIFLQLKRNNIEMYEFINDPFSPSMIYFAPK